MLVFICLDKPIPIIGNVKSEYVNDTLKTIITGFVNNMTSSTNKYKKQTNKLQINKFLKTLLIFTWSNAL